MPFDFSLGTPTEPLPGFVGDYTVDFDLGLDSDTNERVFMQVALYEHEDQPNPFSLLFGIRRQNLDTFHVGPADFDHATVRELIPKGQRENTLDKVIESIQMLVESVDPFEITMETYDENLDAEGMKKYSHISNALAELGYTETLLPRDGTEDQRDHWSFTK